jgi:hypothetical protein
MEIDRRFVFSGHAIGAAAHFHRLDDLHNLNHVIPTLGSSAIPAVGGRSHHLVTNQLFTAEKPRKRTLLSAQHSETTAVGRKIDDTHFETELGVVVRSVDVLEKLHADLVEFHQTSTREWNDPHSRILTSGSKLQGLRLGNVIVNVELEEEPFSTCGTKEELNEFYGAQSEAYRRENSWRFHTPPEATSITDHKGRFYCTLLKKEPQLSGPPEEVSKMKVDCYSIKWDGFGRIFLGEVIISDKERRVTMIRLTMGSDAAGSATIVDAQTNSSTVP